MVQILTDKAGWFIRPVTVTAGREIDGHVESGWSTILR